MNKHYKNPETLACSRSIGYLHRDESMKQVSDVRGNQVGPHFMALQFCLKENIVKIELIVGHNMPPTHLLLSFVYASGADQHWLNLRRVHASISQLAFPPVEEVSRTRRKLRLLSWVKIQFTLHLVVGWKKSSSFWCLNRCGVFDDWNLFRSVFTPRWPWKIWFSNFSIVHSKLIYHFLSGLIIPCFFIWLKSKIFYSV